MLKRLEGLLKSIKESPEFKEYKKGNNDSYLASALLIVEEGSESLWSVDFYSPKRHLLTTFKIMNKLCEKSQESEILQDEKVMLKELKMTEIKTNLAQAFEIAAESLNKENIPAIKKIIVVLQEQTGVPIWNLTYLTAALELINIKIDALRGSLITYSKVPLFKIN